MLMLTLSFRFQTWTHRIGTAPLTACLLLALVAGAQGAVPRAVAPSPLDGSMDTGANTTLAWTMEPLDLIVNGGFEEGLEGWTMQVDGFNAGYRVNDGTRDPRGADGPTPPLEGNLSVFAEQGQFVNSGMVVFQQITIPTNTSQATLRWSHRIRSTGDFDFNNNDAHGFLVQVFDSVTGNTLQLLYLSQSGDPLLEEWIKQSVDLSHFAGQTINIGFFTFITIGNGDLTVHLDRVSLIVDPPAGTVNQVLIDTEPIVGIDDLIGTTEGSEWPAPTLQPDTTYYWRILSTLDSEQLLGPIWTFTTSPLGFHDHFEWSPIASTIPGGTPTAVTITAHDAQGFLVPDYSSTANLSATSLDLSGAANQILVDQPFTALSDYQNTTLGYAFTPDTDLWVTHFRTFGGNNASLWTDDGVLLARQPLSAPNGVWTLTPLAQTIPLKAGSRYRLSFFSDNLQSQSLRFDAPTAFAHGTIHQSYAADGNTFPTTPHPAQWFFVDLNYLTPNATPLTIQPAITDTFVGGTWSGQITLPNVDTQNVAVYAQTSGDTIHGWANLFGIAAFADNDNDGIPNDWETANGLNPENPADADMDFDTDGASNIDEYRAGTDPNDPTSLLGFRSIRIDGGDVVLNFDTISGGEYRIDRATQLDSPNWTQVGGLINGDDTTREVRDTGAASSGPAFYRVFVTR